MRRSTRAKDHRRAFGVDYRQTGGPFHCADLAGRRQPIRDGRHEVGYHAGGIEQPATHPAH